MEPITCLLVDDERLLRDTLAGFIETDCPGLRVVGKAAGAEEARELLAENRVDVIFCDIRMPREDGFRFLESIDASRYHIVFVTAYNEYALKAIKTRAFDYLLKPVDPEELKRTALALEKAIREKRDDTGLRDGYRDAVSLFMQEMRREKAGGKIALHHSSGIQFVELDDILFLEGDGCYTEVNLKNGKKIVSTRILSDFEEGLSPDFFRIHKSYIVNLRHVDEFSRQQGVFVVLNSGQQLAVGRRRIQAVLEKFQQLTKNI